MAARGPGSPGAAAGAASASGQPAASAPPRRGRSVCLMGDSVLDDFFWLKDKTLDVRAQLQGLLGPADRVLNFAVDEAQIREVRRKRPRNQYVVERRRVGLDPYPSEPDGSVWQLHLLQEEAAREETDAFAVLSIGGNDARAAFASSLDLDTIVETMTRRGIVEAYTQLASDVAKLSAGLILVLVYHPRVTPVPLLWLLPPQPVITRLIAKFSFMYFETAIARGLPVIDLARTFNPYLGKDYGSTPIEPSNRSGMFIAELVKHVLDDFQFGEDPARVYWGVPASLGGEGIRSEDLTEADYDREGERYQRQLEAHLARSKAAARAGRPTFCSVM